MANIKSDIHLLKLNIEIYDNMLDSLYLINNVPIVVTIYTNI